MEVPLLLLLQQGMCDPSPAVPWPTRLWQVEHDYGLAPTVPSTGSSLPLPVGSMALPCTHIVGVKHQRMGAAPVPCPEGDTRAGFLAQREQSQAGGHHPPWLWWGGQQRVWGLSGPWVPGSRALGGRCAAAG